MQRTSSRVQRSSGSAGLILVIGLLVALTSLADLSPHAAFAATPPYAILHTFNSYADGLDPDRYCPLLYASDSNLYGVADSGGTNDLGTVYCLTTKGVLTTIHSFTNSGDGYSPTGALVEGSDGYLYGVAYGGEYGEGIVYKVNKTGTSLIVLHNFNNANADDQGYDPIAGLTLAPDGYLYGLTSAGGANSAGAFFKISTSGSSFSVIQAAVTTLSATRFRMAVSGTKLYGVSYSGGAHGYGAIYSLTTSGGSYAALYSFTATTSDGYYPTSLMVNKDGNLYGVVEYGAKNAYGAVFKYIESTSKFSLVYSFKDSHDGANPAGQIAQDSSGNLYGVTTAGGTNADGALWKSTTGGTFTALAALPTGASSNYAGPVLGGSNLYEPTYNGGIANNGQVLACSTGTTPVLSVLFDFANGFRDGRNPYYGDLLLGSDGLFHAGTSSATNEGGSIVYHISTSGAYGIDANPDGNIYGALLSIGDGNYLGTTYNGGYYSSGAVYEIGPSIVDGFDDLYSFGEAAGAELPSGLILGADGNYYGASYAGGQHNAGCIFSLTPDGLETILYSFTGGADGGSPNGGLIMDANGTFYGTTYNGGAHNYGTVFKYARMTGFKSLLSFDLATLGAYPYDGVTMGHDGNLYGTSHSGGAYSVGTVYRVNTDGTANHVVYNFGAKTGYADGASPFSGLFQGSDGNLYGTTFSGGLTDDVGIVYSVTTSGSETVLHKFAQTSAVDGYDPYAGVVEGSDGNFYGTTYRGGIFPKDGATSADTVVSIAGTVYQVQTLLPVIDTVTPSSGFGGQTVTIGGANISGASTVEFNGVSATFSQNATTGVITATIPASATTGLLTVKATKGTAIGFAPFVVPLPVVSSFSPSSGLAGATVTITGSNFVNVKGVYFDGKSAASYTVKSSTSITAVVPATAASGVISVTSAAGTGASSHTFTITAPSISSFTPTSGTAGVSVTITGKNFVGVSAVAFNGKTASYTVGSTTSVTAIVPTTATSGTISVTTPGGKATSTATFTITPPTISSFTPTSGAVGVTVTITGKNFVGVSAVAFNGATASYTVKSSTSITAIVPTGATTGKISVTTPGGKVTSSSTFTVS